MTFLTYSVYFPTRGQDEDFLEVMSTLSFDINQHYKKDSVIIIGCDTNHSVTSSKRRKDAMLTFLYEFSFLSILPDDKPTFHHNNGTSESKIDDIFYFIPQHSNIQIRFQDQLCLNNYPDNLSSHDVIVGELSLPHVPSIVSQEDYSKTYSDFVVKKPKWNISGLPHYQEQVESTVKRILEEFNQPDFLPEASEMVSRALVLAAEQNFRTSNPIGLKEGKAKGQSFSMERQELHQKSCDNWRKAGRPKEANHPARIEKLKTQRYIQMITKME